MKNKQRHILLLALSLFLSSCTTNKILKETNQNLEQLNASIDEKFNRMSQPMDDISKNFAEMSKTINSFSKATEEGGAIDQMSQVLAQLSSIDMGNSFEKLSIAVDRFVDLSNDIESIGGVQGGIMHYALGMTLGTQLLENFKKMTGNETEGDVEQYLIAIQGILNATKNNLDPTVQQLRESIQAIIELKAEEYNIDLDQQLIRMQDVSTSLYQAKEELDKGLVFVNNYQQYAASDINNEEKAAFQNQAEQLAQDYSQRAKEMNLMLNNWEDWSQDNQIAAVEFD